jgi:peptidyl-prolyl cis-trans isomerase C
MDRSKPLASGLPRLLREPLLHFLLIGAVLFAVYRVLQPSGGGQDNAKKIVLTEDDLSQMTLTWRAQGRPLPTEKEMQSLLEEKIREEVLYREALAMGLDKDDTIVKRRMVQKMDFLAEDLSELREPGRDELKAWFAKNSERFTMPGRVSFRHIYFSPDKRGEQALAVAEQARARLNSKSVDSPDAAGLGDSFMFQDFYGDQAFDETAKTFGPSFAQALFQSKPKSWQGPIQSGYGWHLVFIDSLTPARIPEFEEIEADVRTGWVSAQRDEIKRRMYAEIRSRYEIVLPKKSAEAKVARGGK